MKTSPELDYLCSELSTQMPNWIEIQQRYEKLPEKYLTTPRLLQQYAQDFSEIHLDIILEKASENNKDYNLKLLPHYLRSAPLIQHGSKLFHLQNNRLILKTVQYRTWEYDQIAIVNDIPTVFEIKLRDWDKGKTRKRKQRDGSYTIEKSTCLQNNLRPEMYNRKLQPVRDFFRQDVGYVIIISNDQYTHKTNVGADPIVSDFMSNNGKLVPFYTDRITFRTYVREKAVEFGYKIKEEK